MLTLLCWVYPKITQFLPLSWDHHLQYIVETGTNFNVEEDNIHVSAWLNTSIDAVHGNELKQKHSMKKFGNTSANTTHLAPHVLLAPYQVDGEWLIGRQEDFMGS